MDVFVYISLHGFLLPSPLWGRSYVKGQKRGKWSGWKKLSGGSGKERVCQRPVVSLSFLEQCMLRLFAERTLFWSSHPLQLGVSHRDIPRISESSFP